MSTIRPASFEPFYLNTLCKISYHWVVFRRAVNRKRCTLNLSETKFTAPIDEKKLKETLTCIARENWRSGSRVPPPLSMRSCSTRRGRKCLCHAARYAALCEEQHKLVDTRTGRRGDTFGINNGSARYIISLLTHGRAHNFRIKLNGPGLGRYRVYVAERLSRNGCNR